MASINTPVNWAGRTFGELTPDEKRRAVKQAGDQLSAELQANAAQIGEIMEGTYKGLDLEEVFAIADVIQQYVLESKPVGTWWTISAIAAKAGLDPGKVSTVLDWMVEHDHIITNGRGGCWVNYARKY
jgi:hypothetical protein